MRIPSVNFIFIFIYVVLIILQIDGSRTVSVAITPEQGFHPSFGMRKHWPLLRLDRDHQRVAEHEDVNYQFDRDEGAENLADFARTEISKPRSPAEILQDLPELTEGVAMH